MIALRLILIFCPRVYSEPHCSDNNKETLNMKKKKKHMKGNMFPISPSIISPGLLLSKYSISLKIKGRLQ